MWRVVVVLNVYTKFRKKIVCFTLVLWRKGEADYFSPKLRPICSLYLLLLWNAYVTQTVSLGCLWSGLAEQFLLGRGERGSRLLIYIPKFPFQIDTSSKYVCYVGKANLSVLFLWLFSTVRLLSLLAIVERSSLCTDASLPSEKNGERKPCF